MELNRSLGDGLFILRIDTSVICAEISTIKYYKIQLFFFLCKGEKVVLSLQLFGILVICISFELSGSFCVCVCYRVQILFRQNGSESF